MVEAGESEYTALLKTRSFLIFRDGLNAENGKIAPNWNVSGTRDFSFPNKVQITALNCESLCRHPDCAELSPVSNSVSPRFGDF
jgi:hypothetical protein